MMFETYLQASAFAVEVGLLLGLTFATFVACVIAVTWAWARIWPAHGRPRP